MNKFYWIHLDCEGFIGYCKTYEEAEQFCKEYLAVVGEDGSLEWDEANGGLQILVLAAESHIEETKYRKDYFENEESMTHEEYQAACEEYGCLDPDSPECWFTRMKKTPLICSPWRAVRDGLPDFLGQMGGVEFWNGLAAVGGMVLPVSYDAKGWHSMGCLLPEDQVSHWMPLPPPPELEAKPEIGITEE